MKNTEGTLVELGKRCSSVELQHKARELRESIIEDNGLGKFMEEAEDDEVLPVHEAKKQYKSL